MLATGVLLPEITLARVRPPLPQAPLLLTGVWGALPVLEVALAGDDVTDAALDWLLWAGVEGALALVLCATPSGCVCVCLGPPLPLELERCCCVCAFCFARSPPLSPPLLCAPPPPECLRLLCGRSPSPLELPLLLCAPFIWGAGAPLVCG